MALDRDHMIPEVNKIYSERTSLNSLDYLIRDIADWRHEWQCDIVTWISWQSVTVWHCLVWTVMWRSPDWRERVSDQWRLHSGLTYVIRLNTSCQYHHIAGLTSIRNHSIYRHPLRHWLQSTLIIIFTCFYRNKIGHEITFGLKNSEHSGLTQLWTQKLLQSSSFIRRF